MTDTLDTFARSHINRPLRYPSEIAEATALLRERGLPEHDPEAKNWDQALAHWAVTTLCLEGAAVLDAGANPSGSAFLLGLPKSYHRVACNIEFGSRRYRGRERDPCGTFIEEYGDVTALPYMDEYFRFIACLSVIEHGVDVPKFLSEAARVLKPGGHLFLTFDYWPKKEYAQPFDAVQAQGIALVASDVGLTPAIREPDYECIERCVSRNEGSYTFMNLLLRKPP